MNRLIAWMLIPALGLALPPKADAQLSQEQAVRRAVGRHPLIVASRHATQAEAARVSQARTAWIPRIKLEGGYLVMGPVQEITLTVDEAFLPNPISVTREIGSLHNASVGVSVAWRAVDFGARDVVAQAAKAAVAACRAEGKERAAQVAYATRAAYLAALFFREVELVTQRSLKVSRGEQREERIKRRNGVGNDLALARADTRVAELKARLRRAQQERGRVLATLHLLLGIKPGSAVRLTDSLKALGSAPVASRANKARHPTRLKLSALLQASELQLKQQRRAQLPTLDLVGSFKYQYPKNYFENDKAGIAYTAGVVLTWNVFDGDLLRRQRRESRAKIRQVRAMTRAANEEIARKLSDAGAQIRTAAASVTSAKQMIKAARVYVRAARSSLRAGTGTALEVRKAEDFLDQAELAEIKAYFDAALARAALLLAQGVAERK